MKKKIIHSLWTHIPAILSFIVLIVSILMIGPFPSSVPVHFGTGGVPDRYGSPWEVFGIAIGLSVLFIALSVFMDELWIRQEKKKTFNFFALLDEIIVGAMTGFTLSFMLFLDSGLEEYSLSWNWVGIIGGSAVLLGIILELFRPYIPHPARLAGGESASLKAELNERLKTNSSFVFWDSQNPGYLNLVTILIPVVMIIAGILTWTSEIWVSVLVMLVGLLMIIPNGGQRVIVTRNDVSVSWGIFGIKVLKLKIEEITAAELKEFSPLKDFGGYGIRFNREMKAYFMRGSLGVKLDTVSGNKYLIGTDQPENLFTVINTLLENR